MKTVLTTLCLIMIVMTLGCQSSKPEQIHAAEGVGSDSLSQNIVTRPILHAFSALAGHGIEVTASSADRNAGGFLVVRVNGYNRSYKTKAFQYRVEWLDAGGFAIPSKTSVWLPVSAMGKSQFSIKAVATSREASSFRMDTRKRK